MPLAICLQCQNQDPLHPTSYNWKGTRMHRAQRIQNGLYARKNISVQRLLGLAASHKLSCAAALAQQII